ncbi:hypothetical protein [Denitrobaculum tricleocarpae]|uniref:DUF995 domain-containing protein n=1 Tax=Denitrobaculum tricleocarpae TaxID=2591009 RepID=A0A545TAV0_9PROT|nr:hypothetical protein [Denitrobaculum tricleocarpae]TQV74337.1 hypothetical protein FKG95_23925 [Denitrobaculum tricleocarpae]
MNNHKGLLISLGSFLLILSGCATDESIDYETPVELAPMAKVSEPSESHGTNQGKPQMEQRISKEGALETWKVSGGAVDGCQWTGEGWFSPAVSWKNCRNGSTGSQTVTKSGEIWPLVVGKTVSYDVKGSDQKYNWTDTRECVVNAAVHVTVETQKIPAYEVVCKDEWNTRTWYVSPDLKRTIKFKKRHKKRGLESHWIADLK